MTTLTPKVIAIVRHGETDWNLARRIQGRTEVPMNDTGRAQALATARHLHSRETRSNYGDWAEIFSSPLGRAIETASIIADTMSLSGPRIEERLYERDFGPAEGLSVAEAHEQWPGLVIPGAETFESLAERTASVFGELLHEAPGSVVVAHGAMIRAGLSHLTGTDMPSILNAEVWLLGRSESSHHTYRLEAATRLEPATAQPTVAHL